MNKKSECGRRPTADHKGYMKLLLFIPLFFLGCDFNTAQKHVDSKNSFYHYRADMAIQIGDKKFDGVASVNINEAKQIKFVSKAKLDALYISTCNRLDAYEKADKNWYGGVGKEFKYDFIPTNLEVEDNCPIYIQAVDKSGTTAWGYVAFRGNEMLPALVECNGKQYQSVGVTVCQTQQGLEQAITFNNSVSFIADELCEVKKLTHTRYLVVSKGGFCNVAFSDGSSTHTMTVLGYKEIFFRGE